MVKQEETHETHETYETTEEKSSIDVLTKKVKELTDEALNLEEEAQEWHNKYTEMVNLATDFMTSVIPEFKRGEELEEHQDEADYWHDRYTALVNKTSEYIAEVTPQLKRRRCC